MGKHLQLVLTSVLYFVVFAQVQLGFGIISIGVCMNMKFFERRRKVVVRANMVRNDMVYGDLCITHADFSCFQLVMLCRKALESYINIFFVQFNYENR